MSEAGQTIFKAGPTWSGSGKWDDQGKTKVAQISLSGFEGRFTHLQFLYVEDENKLDLSEIYGPGMDHRSRTFYMITLDYPSEFITGISGVYQEAEGYGDEYLRSFTLYTNIQIYGPLEASPPDERFEQFEFNYQVGGKFGGFFGTYNTKLGIRSIGVYTAYGDVSRRIVDVVSDRDHVVNLETIVGRILCCFLIMFMSWLINILELDRFNIDTGLVLIMFYRDLLLLN